MTNPLWLTAHPVRALNGYVGVAITVLGALAVLAAFVAAMAPVVERRWPATWWALIGAPVTVIRITCTWGEVTGRCGLAVTARPYPSGLLAGLVAGLMASQPHRAVAAAKLIPPRRIWLGVNRRGLVLGVRMHKGQEPADYAAAAGPLAHAWHVHAVRVDSPRPGRVRLTVIPRDPLAGESVTLPGPRQPADEASSGGELLRVAVGMREDGAPWVLNLRAVPHWLVIGATRSGKSTLINALVAQLAPRPVALVGIDCKGGMELGLYAARLSALATTRAEAVRLLDALVELMLTRMRLCQDARVRSVWELPAELRPVPVVVIVDEVAELFLAATKADKAETAKAITALIRLAQLGAALGVHLIVAGQRVSSDFGDGVTALRAQLAGRICHRVADQATAAMTLAGMPPEATHAALAITPRQQGTAVTADDSGAWVLARSVLVTATDAERIAEQHAGPTPVLPELTRALAGGEHPVTGDGPEV
jgi:S-DNA-T family DNA segregation ATPase FtsK/SpoIIIE